MFRAILLAAVVSARAAPAAADPAALFQHALELQKSGDYDGAIREYRDFLKLRPRFLNAIINLGASLSATGRYDEAIAEYERAYKIDSANPIVLANLGLAYYKTGQIDLAESQFAAAHALLPSENKITMLLADCRLRLGDDRRVIELLTPLEQKNPDDLAIAYMLGTALIRAKQPERGQLIIDKILRNGDSAEARLLMGATKISVLDFKGAIEDLRHAIELNPKLPSVYSYFGQAQLSNGDSAAAKTAFQTELQLNPYDFDSNLQLGVILRQEQNYRDAEKYLRMAEKLRPGNLAARYELALILVADSKLEEARTELEAITAKEPNVIQAHITLTSVYYRLNRRADGDRERDIVKRLQAEEAKATAAANAAKDAAGKGEK